MRKIIITIFIIFCGLEESFSQMANVVSWDRHYKLKWSDFQATSPNDASVQYGLEASAISAPYIDWFSHSGKTNDYTLCAFFDKSQSWYRNTSELLLQHEQLHFDICELYARKMRGVLDSLKNENVEFASIFNHMLIDSLVNESNSYSDQYDKESMHGKLKNIQKEWNEKVYSELIQWDKYSTDSTGCKCE